MSLLDFILKVCYYNITIEKEETKMFLKITTCCAFVGTESTDIVEVDDNLTEDEIQEIVDSYFQKVQGMVSRMTATLKQKNIE
jgi:hypothetical protein